MMPLTDTPDGDGTKATWQELPSLPGDVLDLKLLQAGHSEELGGGIP